jgi:hypothetical protein
MKPHAGNEFAAFIGIDWAMPNTCLQAQRRSARVQRPGASTGGWTPPGAPRTAPGGASSIRSPRTLWQMDFKGHVALQHGRCHS